MSSPTPVSFGVTSRVSVGGLLDRVSGVVRKTPTLIIELAAVERAYRSFVASFPHSAIFYALKANPDPIVAGRLADMGSGFEIASSAELEMLRELKVDASRIISSNTIKKAGFVVEAYEYGIRHFGFDSMAELQKLRRYAPGSYVSARLAVPNEGSDWPLDKKFGASPQEVVDLMTSAASYGLEPTGITFHVGSQCRDPQSWAVALDIVSDVLKALAKQGIPLRIINIGGGMPIAYANDEVPRADVVAAAVHERTSEFADGVEVWLEPGRAFVGEAGTLVSEVIGLAEREGRRWVYLDVGIFHGLAEAIGGISYTFEAGPGELKPCVIAGPSCDSFDVITKDGLLPELEVGDLVAVRAAGAYSTVYASTFNGFPLPETIVVETL